MSKESIWYWIIIIIIINNNEFWSPLKSTVVTCDIFDIYFLSIFFTVELSEFMSSYINPIEWDTDST